ncbi:threonylcarbamoyl-AMP synthase [Microbulbifer sp. OS29]|uniref:Threonylcarbamoyl-AMP synthase n=1 Tax=Microbulbifer okhotskensis TaxID=2926617 RepID=A0A9X2ENP7_9GAMM|nr:L-threonylcarbamoyladenylate synthase [Microbulbifer okhotskensis]MCO1335051.1 threonylcarbamoyl-AMP synthase [Microbulbifer okhotskensis]
MAQFFQIHPDNPQGRLISQAAEIVAQGGVIVFPTDSAYAIGCRLGEKLAVERIRAMRQLDKQHNFTLMCRDLSELATYAKVDNQMFRLLKNHTPGPYTFIMPATAEVPRRLIHPKRKTIGIRVPDNAITLALIEELGEPLMSCSLIMPGEEQPLTEPYDIRDTLEHQVELVIDGGFCGVEATTVLDLTGDEPQLVRQGCGATDEILG